LACLSVAENSHGKFLQHRKQRHPNNFKGSQQELWPLQVSALYATTTVKIGEYGMCYGWGALSGAIVAGFVIQRVNQARYTLAAITLFLTIIIGSSAIVGMPSTSLTR